MYGVYLCKIPDSCIIFRILQRKAANVSCRSQQCYDAMNFCYGVYLCKIPSDRLIQYPDGAILRPVFQSKKVIGTSFIVDYILN